MDVAASWGVIHTWLDRNAPEMRRHLNGPADESAFDLLERQTGFTLPEDFRASYRIHNGSAKIPGPPYAACRIIAGLPLLPISEMLRYWEEWCEYATDEVLLEDLKEGIVATKPEGFVTLAYADQGWLPFAGEESHFLALDFTPGPRGQVGQVINFGRDDDFRHAVAPTFGDFLSYVARMFREDELVVDPEYALTLNIRRTGKDLLRSLPQLPYVDGVGGFA